MKEYRINANVVSLTKDDGILTLGFSDTVATDDQPIYLLLQRAEGEKAIYVEINDQLNSSYDIIMEIANRPGDLIIKVKPEFKKLGNPETIHVTYTATTQNTEAVHEGLKQIISEA